ncbi:hypothetical protein PPACK8108_LOCUS16210 [Phakopsora pachyrhizi]|uniref:Uncharacterized protein n=1 Tax=Phakopsora pachyrhizi TaxID=170000 RepID=A0AAV0B9U8_PHAPC|nr:hypothetical protein PPACK8108_LOCUS16210 [Phakopsora pachyrhizi]
MKATTIKVYSSGQFGGGGERGSRSYRPEPTLLSTTLRDRKEKGFIGWSNQEAEGAKKAISELLQQATEFVDQQASRVPVIDGKNFPATTMTTVAKISFTQEDEEQQRYNKEPLEEEARPGMPAMTVEQQVEPKPSNDRTGNGNSSFNKSQPVWR